MSRKTSKNNPISKSTLCHALGVNEQWSGCLNTSVQKHLKQTHKDKKYANPTETIWRTVKMADNLSPLVHARRTTCCLRSQSATKISITDMESVSGHKQYM